MIQSNSTILDRATSAAAEPAADEERQAWAALEAAPTVFGLNPTQLHDRFWASRGVQVVRQGERSEIVAGADVFLLTDPRLLTLFNVDRFVNMLWWDKAELMCVRLHDPRDHGYRERIVADNNGQLVGFRRHYRGADPRLARAVLTRSRELAGIWQRSSSPREAWLEAKKATPRTARMVLSAKASVYDRLEEDEVMLFIRRLVRDWKRPETTIHRPLRNVADVWADRESTSTDDARFIGPVWIGAGRKLTEPCTVLGPAILWDDPECRPQIESLRWDDIQPDGHVTRPIRPKRLSGFSRGSKRAFDIIMALIGLAITAPLYPLVMLAIWLEDGRPFFFAHRRETCGGREFHCLKFRSMRKDAEAVKAKMKRVNEADGPHFFIEYDPRHTRVGRLLRKTNIDEIPQLINVLMGDMSLVGPRPSPYSENQFCPAWREARLSMRPGITGLWQVKRTRQSGLDFQEWIKFDIEYVETATWRLDLWILWKTIFAVLKREQ